MIIAPIVEGFAEVASMRTLVRRIRPTADVAKPVRGKRYQLVKEGELERAIDVVLKTRYNVTTVLLVLDADDDCPAELGPRLQARGARYLAGRGRFAVVLARSEIESWFLAGEPQARGRDVEAVRDAKGALADARGTPYSDVVDQPSFAASFDLFAARQGCRSFRKFEQEVLAAT